MINWDYMITYGGPELFVAFIVIVITPLIYWLILKRLPIAIRIISIVGLWFAGVFVAYWDVYQIAKETEHLCKEEAGLHVYKTVEAEGFLGPINIEYWAKYGFKYVEGLYQNNKTRLMLNDNKIIRETVSDYISRYQVKTESKTLDLPIVKTREMILDRQTNETLGEIISFKFYPGWLDSKLLGIMGFTWIPPRCDGNYLPKRQKRTIYYDDLIKKVIKPVESIKEGVQ